MAKLKFKDRLTKFFKKDAKDVPSPSQPIPSSKSVPAMPRYRSPSCCLKGKVQRQKHLSGHFCTCHCSRIRPFLLHVGRKLTIFCCSPEKPPLRSAVSASSQKSTQIQEVPASVPSHGAISERSSRSYKQNALSPRNSQGQKPVRPQLPAQRFHGMICVWITTGLVQNPYKHTRWGQSRSYYCKMSSHLTFLVLNETSSGSQ